MRIREPRPTSVQPLLPVRRPASAAALVGLLLFAAAPMASAASRPKVEQAKIDWLLKRIETADAVFIRNGDEHSAGAAASHLRSKLWWAGKRVQTVQDFIDGVASHSEETKKPYEIRLKDGRTLPLRDWLYARLAEHERKKSPAIPTPG